MERNSRFCLLSSFLVLVLVSCCYAGSDDMIPLAAVGGQLQQTCTCGTANKATRIIGGTETKVNKYPWMAEIVIRNTVSTTKTTITKLCGGALINENYVVTAAHCFGSNLTASDLLVDLGDHDISRTDDTPTPTTNKFVKVEKIILHDRYDRTTVSNDIALLKLLNPVQFTREILPACLPPIQLDMTDQTIKVTGYGSLEQGGPLSNILMEVDIPVVDNAKCKNNYKTSKGIIDSSVFCAGTPDGTKDSCQGDSGSPATVMCDDIYTFAGVVSYGVGCGNPNYPGVLSNVSYFMNWIVQKAVGASLCVHNCRNNVAPPSDCGWANTPKKGKRIVGGGYTASNQYPWMAAVYAELTYKFGGTLLSKNWVLTSAKPLANYKAGDLQVVLGSDDLYAPAASEQSLYVSQIVINPDYVDSKFPNDLALLKLSTPAVFNLYVSPICLPSTKMNKDFDNVNLNLIAYGQTADGDDAPYSGRLKEAIVKAIPNNDCYNTPGYSTAVTSSTVCTVSNGYGDVCNGDAGSPLMTQGSSGRMFLAAVQSYKYKFGCGTKYPSGNTRVSYFLNWISSVTGVQPYNGNDNIFG